MRAIYLTVTILTALANGYAATLNFLGAESVKIVADRVRVPTKWMVPFGALLASGALGLLAGIFVPPLGAAAALGLVLYFVCALGAHLRVGDKGIGGALTFLTLAVASFASNLAYHDPW